MSVVKDYVSDQVSTLWKSTFTELGKLVQKGTEDSDAPSPGFIHHELSKYTYKSLEESRAIQDLLVKRLQHASPRVKSKALKCIRFVADKGHASFAADMRTPARMEYIRMCTQCHGPPDPLLGDALYKAVREDAESVMSLLFRLQNNPNSNLEYGSESGEREMPGIHMGSAQGAVGYSQGGGVRSLSSDGGVAPGYAAEPKGFGYDPSKAGYSTGTGDSQEGKGSYMAYVTPSEDTVNMTKRLLELAGEEMMKGITVAKGKVDEYRYGTAPPGVNRSNQGSGNSTYQLSNSAMTRHPPSGTSAHATSSSIGGGYGYRSQGSPGGAWGSTGGTPTPPARSRPPASPSTPSGRASQASGRQGATPARKQGMAFYAMDKEENLEENFVRDLTLPGGVRAVPPREVLAKFISRWPKLDASKTVRLLIGKLNADEWQSRLKSMIVLEEIVELCVEDETSQRSIEVFETLGKSASLRTMDTSPHRSIRDKFADLKEVIPERYWSVKVVNDAVDDKVKAAPADRSSPSPSPELSNGNHIQSDVSDNQDLLDGFLNDDANDSTPVIIGTDEGARNGSGSLFGFVEQLANSEKGGGDGGGVALDFDQLQISEQPRSQASANRSQDTAFIAANASPLNSNGTSKKPSSTHDDILSLFDSLAPPPSTPSSSDAALLDMYLGPNDSSNANCSSNSGTPLNGLQSPMYYNDNNASLTSFTSSGQVNNVTSTPLKEAEEEEISYDFVFS